MSHQGRVVTALFPASLKETPPCTRCTTLMNFFAQENEHPHQEGQTTRFLDIHVYDLPPGEQEPPSVESEPEREPASQHEREEEPPARPGTWRFSGRVLICFAVSSLLLGALVVFLAIQTPPAEATITIVPIEKQITMTSTITVVTGQAVNPAQVPGRTLAAMTMSQQQTIPTTGTAHQDATAAHGYLTFYNAAPFAQTIVAGTVVTGADGVPVVTDQDAILPAVAYPTLGHASTSAHAVSVGPAGNILAGDIYGPCCRLNVSAVNNAFTGGQVARDYHTVTQQDISTVATSLTKSLMRSEQAALQTQVRPDETLLTSLPCQQIVTPDRQPGTEATQVQVMVSEICQGMVYHTQAYQSLMTQIANQKATQQLGNGYILAGTVQSTITQATPQKQNAMVLQVNIVGTYVSQLSQEQLQQLPAFLTGKSKAQAIAFLLHTPGIQSVSVSSAMLPADVERIHVIVIDAG